MTVRIVKILIVVTADEQNIVRQDEEKETKTAEKDEKCIKKRASQGIEIYIM